MTPPVVVIGAGVDGLVAALYLARSGRRVVVLQRPATDHGQPHEGWIPPRIVSELTLHRHGLRLWRPDPWAAAPLPDGGRLELWVDPAKAVDAIRRVSPADAANWPAFCQRVGRLARLLESLSSAPPPDLLSRDLREVSRLAALGWRVRGLGKQGMIDLLRFLPMSVAELLDEWFESDLLKGVLGAAGVMHLAQGPRAGGTAFLLLHHHVGSPSGVFRPPRSNLKEALLGAARGAGIEIRRGSEVARITVRDRRVTGVALDSGEELVASLVVSSADPRRTLLGLVDPGWLDPELVQALRHLRCRGVVARVTLTLDRAPGFTPLALAPSLEYLERAHDDAKYGRVSRRPYLEAHATDGTAAAEAGHRVDVHLQYAPYTLADGEWTEARRCALGDLAIDLLAEHAPGLREAIRRRVVESPRDLEAAYGFPEGQAYHGEMTLDQILFMRPLPVLARYRTPIEGLYLCGPGTHPGGGIAGASGANVARAVLQDSRR